MHIGENIKRTEKIKNKMAHSKKPKNSEVDAYSYIRNQLEKLGWVVKNPARVPEGEVYKQNEGLYNLDIKEVLDRDMPEAIIKLNECDLWVIESKRDKKDIDKALDTVDLTKPQN